MYPKVVLALMHVLEVTVHLSVCSLHMGSSSYSFLLHPSSYACPCVNCAPFFPRSTGTAKYSTTLPGVMHLLELILWVSVSIITTYSLYWQFSCFP